MAVRKRFFKRKSEIDDAFDLLETDFRKAIILVGQRFGLFHPDEMSVVEAVCLRFDSRIETLQANHPRNHVFRVFLSFAEVLDWRNYPASRKSFCVAVTDTSLAYAVVKAYLSICKSAKRWIT
jgi:hypothetical protein